MASIIDIAMARRGTLDPDFAGINWARAGDRQWHRLRAETEHDFLARVCAEAHAAGYRVVDIGGAIEVGDAGPGLGPVEKKLSPPPPPVAADRRVL